MIEANEEQQERRKLVGYCEGCDEWYKFINDLKNPDVRLHPVCGGKPSVRNGFQITTQRTFNSSAKKLSKAAQKKMSLGA
jgi:hypothetical protein